MHTEVPESMEGRGVASALAKFAFEYAKEHGNAVKIYCPFVGTYLERHPEFRSLVDKEH
jgi:predicted GNAT family acetyltransferase